MLKKIALSLCFTLFLGLLSACSPSETLRFGKTESKPSHAPENISRTNTPGSIGTPIALPPRFDNDPLKPGQMTSEAMPNGLPALSPMKGINYDTLFAEKIKNSGERFDRVENAVTDLRRELETYKPAIVRLAAVESDIQGLIKELEVLLQETPSPQPPLGLKGGGADAKDNRTVQDVVLDIQQLDPKPATPPNIPAPAKSHPDRPPAKARGAPTAQQKTASVLPSQKKKRKPAKDFGGLPTALNFRVGEHNDTLRIAFDTNKATPFTVELDNEEHLILIELPQASWDGKRERSFPNSALLETLSVEPTNGEKGSMVIISLKKDTKILQRKHLSPDKTSDYHRVYFDLKL